MQLADTIAFVYGAFLTEIIASTASWIYAGLVEVRKKIGEGV